MVAIVVYSHVYGGWHAASPATCPTPHSHVAVCLIVVALIGGMGWFAFNYGQMTAQRDHLAMQLNQYHQAPAKKVPVSYTHLDVYKRQTSSNNALLPGRTTRPSRRPSRATESRPSRRNICGH